MVADHFYLSQWLVLVVPLTPRLSVGSCLTHALEGCTIVTIGPPKLIQRCYCATNAGAFHPLYIWAAATGISSLRRRILGS